MLSWSRWKWGFRDQWRRNKSVGGSDWRHEKNLCEWERRWDWQEHWRPDALTAAHVNAWRMLRECHFDNPGSSWCWPWRSDCSHGHTHGISRRELPRLWGVEVGSNWRVFLRGDRLLPAGDQKSAGATRTGSKLQSRHRRGPGRTPIGLVQSHRAQLNPHLLAPPPVPGHLRLRSPLLHHQLGVCLLTGANNNEVCAPVVVPNDNSCWQFDHGAHRWNLPRHRLGTGLLLFLLRQELLKLHMMHHYLTSSTNFLTFPLSPHHSFTILAPNHYYLIISSRQQSNNAVEVHRKCDILWQYAQAKKPCANVFGFHAACGTATFALHIALQKLHCTLCCNICTATIAMQWLKQKCSFRCYVFARLHSCLWALGWANLW